MTEGARTQLPQTRSTPDAAATQRPTKPAPAASSGGAPARAYAGPPTVTLGGYAGHTPSQGVPGGSQALPDVTRHTLEKGFGVDLSAVRLHTDSHAAQAASTFSARAFTFGPHIFLGSGERPTDLGLLAHEVAHVVQQRGAPMVQLSGSGPGPSNAFELDAQRASVAVLRGEPPTVRERVTTPRVQRLGISDALDYFADKANNIPGYRMFTVILGLNPINMSRVERSAANILRALVEFLPGGHLITEALDKYGVFDRVGGWIEGQISTLGVTGSSIRRAVMDFLDSLGWRDIFHLGSVWDRAKRIFTEPIDRIIAFGRGLVTGIIRFIKDAILKPLAKLAEGTRGYDLLKAVLGFDPITGDAVPRNADTLIGGFMKLIGQEEVWNNLKRANAVARAWAWFQGALGGLLGFVRQIPSLFLSALQQLELTDIVLITRAFGKIARVFGGFIGSFLSWAGQQVMSLLQIIFEVVAPAVMPYVRKAAGAFQMILRNPVGFIRNLVQAGIQGFRQFARNFLSHLRKSLIEWLTGTLTGAGVYIPQAFELREIIKFVLSVLGLVWGNIRGKLVRVVGEPAVHALETGFDIVVTLVREGPAAAWDKIRESLSNLREMVMEQIMTFVRDRVVQAAITRLITSLNPAGAFIQAIIATYNTVMFFVERLKQIAQVAMSFIDSIAAIASGNTGTAASRVETTMAGLLTLVISFLARIAGLGKVSDAVTNIINRVRAPIDRALDRVVDWIVATARRLGRGIAQAGVPQDPNERLRLGKQAALAAMNRFAGRPAGSAVLAPLLAAIRTRYGFASLEAVPHRGRWSVVGTINPRFDEATEALTPEGLVPGQCGQTLLVGEGNFTFALSIAIKTRIGSRLVATDYMVNERKSLQKTPTEQRRAAAVEANVRELTAMGVQVDRQVDARDPSSYPAGALDIIVFNHPLVITRDEQGRSVRGGEAENVQLVRQFLASAKQRIREGGQIVLISSLFRLQRWKLDQVAAGLNLEQSVLQFLASDFPRYQHEKTERPGGARTVQTSEQFAIVFTIKASKSG